MTQMAWRAWALFLGAALTVANTACRPEMAHFPAPDVHLIQTFISHIMVGAFTIRRCTVDDSAALASLAARLFTEAYGPTHPEPELGRYLARSFSVEEVRLAISDDDASMFMVEDSSGVPIAYAYLRAASRRPDGVEGQHPAEIVRLYVDSASQGRGVGAALMDVCLTEAKNRGADVIWLQVWTEAPWAVGFYQRMGFSVVDSAPFYFGDRIDKDHIMSRPL